jgi:methylenetetrahydrofolate--tRNA-(uracil-5-)-methyltransferase
MNGGVHIIGGGLAGSEAAWQLAEAGISVRLSEMRGSGESTPAHHGDSLAELVCSNSFRSDEPRTMRLACSTRRCGGSVP